MDNELEYCKDLYDLIEEYQIGVSPDEISAYYVSILWVVHLQLTLSCLRAHACARACVCVYT